MTLFELRVNEDEEILAFLLSLSSSLLQLIRYAFEDRSPKGFGTTSSCECTSARSWKIPLKKSACTFMAGAVGQSSLKILHLRFFRCRQILSSSPKGLAVLAR